jgi:carboxylesterase type B
LTIVKIYVFKNIRFGAPATGPLRWAKPAPPATESTVQLGLKGPSCLSGITSSLMAMGDGFSGGGKGGKGKGGLGGMLGGADVSGLMNKMTGASEDCLFLDVYVPAKALKAGAAKLPVVNWIYGGAYLIGDKNYDGAAVVKASGNNVVYVAGNYRVSPPFSLLCHCHDVMSCGT